jgi:hypothetical protein
VSWPSEAAHRILSCGNMEVEQANARACAWADPVLADSGSGGVTNMELARRYTKNGQAAAGGSAGFTIHSTRRLREPGGRVELRS